MAVCNQIDYVHDGTSNYCGVHSISCGDPTCQDTTITPTPSRDNTPTPVQGPSCNSIELLNDDRVPITGAGDSDLSKGDAIRLKCGASASVNNYEFRIKAGGTTTAISGTSDNPQISERYIIESNGAHSAQCRICTGEAASTCQEWETL